MLQRIGKFIRTFFELFFGDLSRIFGKKNKKEDEPLVEPPPEELEPQDGSDIPQDTVVVVETNLEEIIADTSVTDPVPTEEPPEEETAAEESEVPGRTKNRFLWCLDNGHGKLTAGKRSPKLKDDTRFYEYEFNRIIVKGIIKELKKQGVKYYEVVPEVNVDNFLRGRVLRANNVKSKLPKIFVSVHANAGPGLWTTAKGVETWYYYGSKAGKQLASVFQKKLIEALGWTNRGLKSQASGQFYVLRNTSMPAILTENGFYNNREEVYLLLDKKIQQKIIDAHVAAILYFEEKGI